MGVDKRDNGTESGDMLGDVAQLGLFGGEAPVKKPKPKPTAVSKVEYYLSVSSLQKFIRRGMVEDAVAAARVVFSFNRGALRRRLMVIAMEDVGIGDLDAIRKAMPMVRLPKQPLEVFEEAVRILAGAMKNRDADDGFNMVIWAREGRECRVDLPDPDEFEFLVKNATYMGDHPDRDRQFWDWAEDEARERGPNCVSLIEFLRPYQKLASWHANHIALLVLARWDRESDDLRVPAGYRTEPGCRDDDVMKRLHSDHPVCLLGMDGHTYQGKMALKKVGEKHGLDTFDMHCFEFFSRGGALDQRAFWENDYRRLVLGFLYGPEGDPRLEEANADLDGFRKWAWNKLVVPQIEKHRESQ